MRKYATPVDALPVEKEYAFEVRLVAALCSAIEAHAQLQVAASNLRFGEGVTREVGMDFKNMKARKVWYIHSCARYIVSCPLSVGWCFH